MSWRGAVSCIMACRAPILGVLYCGKAQQASCLGEIIPVCLSGPTCHHRAAIRRQRGEGRSYAADFGDRRRGQTGRECSWKRGQTVALPAPGCGPARPSGDSGIRTVRAFALCPPFVAVCYLLPRRGGQEFRLRSSVCDVVVVRNESTKRPLVSLRFGICLAVSSQVHLATSIQPPCQRSC